MVTPDYTAERGGWPMTVTQGAYPHPGTILIHPCGFGKTTGPIRELPP